ncbi:MAG: hypothetical protein K2H25_00945, partial [Alistipes sp.]|nr:hypothetical protein [Alistipes sp.]
MKPVVFLFALFCGVRGMAQVVPPEPSDTLPISVAEYCDAVLAYSRQLKSATARSLEASEQMRRARTGFLPRLSAAGSFAVAARRFDGAE